MVNVGGTRTISPRIATIDDRLPRGLSRLYSLGTLLAKPDSQLPDHLRVIVSVPTYHLASIALCLGAFQVDWGCDARCAHRVLAEEPRMAAVYSDRHLQDRQAWLNPSDARVHVGPQDSYPTSRGIHLLPVGFPKRDPLPRVDNFVEEIDDLGETLEHKVAAGVERSELGAHPVIVVGYVSKFHLDVRMSGSPFDDFHPLGRLAPGSFGPVSNPGWFRYPVLLTQKIPELKDNFEWLTEVQPRLIVYVGMSAARASALAIWPKTPAVVVLSRRSSSSADCLEAIETLGWEQQILQHVDSQSCLLPGNGIEVSHWVEQITDAPSDLEGDEAAW